MKRLTLALSERSNFLSALGPPFTEVNSRRRGEIEQKRRDNEGETKKE